MKCLGKIENDSDSCLSDLTNISATLFPELNLIRKEDNPVFLFKTKEGNVLRIKKHSLQIHDQKLFLTLAKEKHPEDFI